MISLTGTSATATTAKTEVSSANSAVEAMCVSVQGVNECQLARQLTAAAASRFPFHRLDLSAPFARPLTLRLVDDRAAPTDGIDRAGAISACETTTHGMCCRTP